MRDLCCYLHPLHRGGQGPPFRALPRLSRPHNRGGHPGRALRGPGRGRRAIRASRGEPRPSPRRCGPGRGARGGGEGGGAAGAHGGRQVAPPSPCAAALPLRRWRCLAERPGGLGAGLPALPHASESVYGFISFPKGVVCILMRAGERKCLPNLLPASCRSRCGARLELPHDRLILLLVISSLLQNSGWKVAEATTSMGFLPPSS